MPSFAWPHIQGVFVLLIATTNTLTSPHAYASRSGKYFNRCLPGQLRGEQPLQINNNKLRGVIKRRLDELMWFIE